MQPSYHNTLHSVLTTLASRLVSEECVELANKARSSWSYKAALFILIFSLITLMVKVVVFLVMDNPSRVAGSVAALENMTRIMQELFAAGMLMMGALLYIMVIRRNIRQQGANVHDISREDVLTCLSKAEQGDIASIMQLAEYCRWGRWFKPDIKMIIALYAVASEQGDHRASLLIAKAYGQDGDLDRDPQQEYEWLLKAKEQGSREAAERIANITNPPPRGSVSTAILIGLLLGISLS